MTKRKDGRWQEAVMINGVRKYFYGKTKAEVLRKINDFREKQETGPLFADIAEAWMEDASAEKRSNTIKLYRTNVNHAVNFLGHIPVRQITPKDIQQSVHQFAKTHRSAVCHHYLNTVARALGYAVNEGIISANPAREIKVPSTAPKSKAREPLPPGSVEIVKSSVDKPFGIFALALLATGMRRGELLALRYEDIDWEAKTISITKQLTFLHNNPVITPPKTDNSSSVVPLLPILENALPKKKAGIVFPSAKHPDQYMTRFDFRHRWEEYRRATGLEVTPHQFRHEYATMLFEADLPPEDIQILLRHAKLSTTMEIYVTLRDKKIAKALERARNANLM